ncbi:unnamed protein product [Clavelina lepadiformis]|uniref:Uncharacterized protein n=1 Tax=Clavelina lepadiformis TaxID=159417 RepID=A0ABP0FNT6_CLALP
MFSKKFILCLFVLFVAYYWLNYIKKGPVYESKKSLDGKTVLITGGNAGIGKATALELANKGARVVIASRNMKKSQAVVDDIIKTTRNKKIRSMHLDLADFDSVKTFAKEFDESEQYLDYLINNAGMLTATGKAPPGVNKLFAINHFGPFLLTNLLLPKMKTQSKSRPVRILNLSSGTYRWGFATKENMYKNVTSSWDMYEVYAATKIANIFFTSKLNDMLSDYDITTYAIHPGFIDSEIEDNFTDFFQILVNINAFLFKRSIFYGCQTTLYCALDDKVTADSGHYFSNCQREELYARATNKTEEKLLWEISAKITGLDK